LSHAETQRRGEKEGKREGERERGKVLNKFTLGIFITVGA